MDCPGQQQKCGLHIVKAEERKKRDKTVKVGGGGGGGGHCESLIFTIFFGGLCGRLGGTVWV